MVMKYEVKIDEHKYTIEAPNSYEAKVRAASQHFKANPSRFSSPIDVLRSKIVVNKIEETP